LRVQRLATKLSHPQLYIVFMLWPPSAQKWHKSKLNPKKFHLEIRANRFNLHSLVVINCARYYNIKFKRTSP